MGSVVKGRVLSKYNMDHPSFFVVDEDGRGLYVVSEPSVYLEEQRIYSLLRENLYFLLSCWSRWISR
ncbi:MAG: hypothetical protein ACPLIG_04405 [Candidatus Bathyarchaeales archaeon]